MWLLVLCNKWTLCSTGMYHVLCNSRQSIGSKIITDQKYTDINKT